MMNGPDTTPGSMLEVYMHALASRTNDDFLDQVNLGIGNYDEAEYWQQVEAFKKGLFADAGITRKVIKRAVLETKMELVAARFGEADESLLDNVEAPECDCDDECSSKRAYLREHGDELWRGLGYTASDGERYTTQEHQAWLVQEVTDIDPDWVPPHWRMLKMRHEASRSKQARLLDNLFGRPPEPEPMAGGQMQAMEDFE